MTNSKILFESSDNFNFGLIKCAKKDNVADLKTQGVAKIEIKLKVGKILEIDKVIFAQELKEHLVSLRKFVQLGLTHHLISFRSEI